jgi:hypothetical protein
MATAAQILANRANAQRSTGPVSIEGKQNSRFGALTHGLTSKQVVLPHENREEFEQLRAGFMRDYKPANAVEETMVDRIAQAYWRSQRAYAAETAFLANRIESLQEQNPDLDPDAAAALMFIEPAEMARMRLIMRYVNSAERVFNKAVADLQKAQQERRKLLENEEPAEIGFVSQQPESSRGAGFSLPRPDSSGRPDETPSGHEIGETNKHDRSVKLDRDQRYHK